MSPSQPERILQISLPDPLHEKLHQAASNRGMKATGFVRLILTNSLPGYETEGITIKPSQEDQKNTDVGDKKPQRGETSDPAE